MKNYFVLSAILLLSFTGCTTTQVNTTDEMIRAVQPSIQPLVTALMRIGIDYGAKKSGADAAQIRADIQPIADKIYRGSTLAASAAGNLMTPASFCELMKVKDDNLTRVLQSLVPMYSDYYAEWKKDPTNVKIFAYSQCILDGLSLLSNSLDKATDQ